MCQEQPIVHACHHRLPGSAGPGEHNREGRGVAVRAIVLPGRGAAAGAAHARAPGLALVAAPSSWLVAGTYRCIRHPDVRVRGEAACQQCGNTCLAALCRGARERPAGSRPTRQTRDDIHPRTRHQITQGSVSPAPRGPHVRTRGGMPGARHGARRLSGCGGDSGPVSRDVGRRLQKAWRVRWPWPSLAPCPGNGCWPGRRRHGPTGQRRNDRASSRCCWRPCRGAAGWRQPGWRAPRRRRRQRPAPSPTW